MRVAALYDVHGNLPALEAVLADVDARGVDEIVVGGDVCRGPMPVECVDRLRARRARASSSGNCERDVLQPTTDGPPLVRRDAARRATRARASARGRRRSSVDVDGLGRVRLLPRDAGTSTTRSSRGSRPTRPSPSALGASTADVVVVRPHARPVDRRVTGAPRLVNAGSVGMPYEGAPGARWALSRRRGRARRDATTTSSRRLSFSAPRGSRRSTMVRAPRCAVSSRAEEATAHFERRRGA